MKRYKAAQFKECGCTHGEDPDAWGVFDTKDGEYNSVLPGEVIRDRKEAELCAKAASIASCVEGTEMLVYFSNMLLEAEAKFPSKVARSKATEELKQGVARLKEKMYDHLRKPEGPS